MALSVSLPEPSISVDPGGFVRTDVRIRNTGRQTERARVDVTGAAERWAWVVPPDVEVAAGAEAVVSLGFRVPRAADPPAGTYSFAVEVAGANDDAIEPADTASHDSPGSLIVRPFHQVTVDLDPPGAKPTARTERQVVVQNLGNVPATTSLRPSGEGHDVDLTIGSPTVDTPPGARIVVPVEVRAVKRSLLQGRTLSFAITAEPSEGGPLTVSGGLEQPPRLPPRAALIIAVGILLMALGVWLTVASGGSSGTAAMGGPTASSTRPSTDPSVATGVAVDVDDACPATGHTDPMPIGTVRDPASLPAAFSFFRVAEDGCQPVRWNPCQPIHYVVNPANASPTGVADVKEAFRRLGVATGLTYVDDGVTDELTGGTARAYQPARYGEKWAPILVHWQPAGVPNPTGIQRAGGGAPTRVGNVYVSGELLLASSLVTDERTQTTIGGGFDDPITIGRIGADGVRWGRVILHELGHVAGLGHTADKDQLMYPDASEHLSTTAFQAGDLAGMKFLGKDAGCIETPAPAPVPQSAPGSRLPTTTNPAPRS